MAFFLLCYEFIIIKFNFIETKKNMHKTIVYRTYRVSTVCLIKLNSMIGHDVPFWIVDVQQTQNGARSLNICTWLNEVFV